jgi:ribulose bisphosphate carboxylase small subunit
MTTFASPELDAIHHYLQAAGADEQLQVNTRADQYAAYVRLVGLEALDLVRLTRSTIIYEPDGWRRVEFEVELTDAGHELLELLNADE